MPEPFIQALSFHGTAKASRFEADVHDCEVLGELPAALVEGSCFRCGADDPYPTFKAGLQTKTMTAHPKIDPVSGEWWSYGQFCRKEFRNEMALTVPDRHGAIVAQEPVFVLRSGAQLPR